MLFREMVGKFEIINELTIITQIDTMNGLNIVEASYSNLSRLISNMIGASNKIAPAGEGTPVKYSMPPKCLTDSDRVETLKRANLSTQQDA